VNIPQSDEDSLKLKELMELCTNLQNIVLDLETTNTTQAMKIESVKRRVKKLKKKQRSRTYKLKRLYKIGLTAKVDSFDEASLGEDASKQERIINDIDANEGITLVDESTENQGTFNDQEDAKIVVDEVNAVSTATTTTATINDITLVKALMEIKSVKPKADKVMIQEPRQEEQEKLIDEEKPRLFMQFLKKRRKIFAAKVAKEKRNIPPTQAQKRKIMCTYLKNMEGKKLKDLKNKSFNSIQKMFDRAFKRVNTFVDYITELVVESSKEAEAKVKEGSSKRAGEELKQKNAKKQKMKDDKESAELKQCLEIIPEARDDVIIDAKPLSSKEDLEVLWRLVKTRFEKIKLVDYMDNLLLHNLKTMFKHHVEDNVWENQQGLVKVLNWKLYDSYGVHCVTLKSIPFYMFVEKMYPLTNHTLHQMFNNVKLQVDYECEMAFELLRLGIKQLK
nr:hypothetical protein [Tanacetum cinerariifolium]